jgi:hypothetical protein
MYISRIRTIHSGNTGLKRVFNGDADTCRASGAAVRIIAGIEDSVGID